MNFGGICLKREDSFHRDSTSHFGSRTVLLADRMLLITVGANKLKSTSGRKQPRRRNLGADRIICIATNGVGTTMEIQ